MNDISRKIRKVAHLAAQECAYKAITFNRDCNDEPKLSPAKLRVIVLDHLVKAGFPRCLLDSTAGIEPVFSKLEEDDEGGWYALNVFAVAELAVYSVAYTDKADLESLCWSRDRGEYYGGAGRPYSHGGHVRRQGNHFIHTQGGGWDI